MDVRATTLCDVNEMTGVGMLVTIRTKSAVNEYAREAALKWIDEVLRHHGVRIQTDGEPAITSLVSHVQMKRNCDTQLRNGPMYCSGSQDKLENYIRRGQEQSRVLKLHIENVDCIQNRS